MQTLPSTKRGDTFAFIASLNDDNGNPLSGASSLLKSEIRDNKDNLIATLTITETDTPGEYLFKTTKTSDWPVNTYLYTDIQFTTNDGNVSSSETIRLLIEKDVTL